MKKTLAEIAKIVGGTLAGDGSIEICGVTNIEEAGSKQITFAVPPHLEKAAASQAAAVIIPAGTTAFSRPAVRVDNPRLAFTQLLELFTPPLEVPRGIHPTAVIGKGAVLGRNVSIMAQVVIADGAVIGDDTVLYPHVFVGEQAVVGSNTLLYPSVTIRERCHIGNRCIIHSGAVIGSDGFGFVTVEGRHHKVPQVGNVVIEDNVELGANTAIDRATTGSTIVKQGTKVDNLVHLAHNVVIGENCFLVAQTGIAGSVTVGDNVIFAGQSGSAGHLSIGSNSVFAAKSGVISDVPQGSFYAGFPAIPHSEWIKSQGIVHKLPQLMRKIHSLEKRLAELEAGEQK